MGFGGGFRCGVGSWIEKFESAAPRLGCEGIVPWWVRKVRLVLYPEIYCDRKSNPICGPSGPRGSQRAVTEMLTLVPGTTATFSAVAKPSRVSLTSMEILKKGTLAE